VIQGDRIRLGQVVDNLLSNALRHCNPGGKIVIRVTPQEAGVELCLFNSGEPVPEADLPLLFEPFYSVRADRNRAAAGTGLGLSIVRAIVEGHGGRCSVANRPGGVEMRVFLPFKQ
jgi:signal transduction histidine kinase